jgi:hypothetical protein
MFTHFNGVYLRTFSKLKRNVISGVWCDILSKDGASHMSARATLSNGRAVNENGGGTVVIRAMQMYVHFWGPSVDHYSLLINLCLSPCVAQVKED